MLLQVSRIQDGILQVLKAILEEHAGTRLSTFPLHASSQGSHRSVCSENGRNSKGGRFPSLRRPRWPRFGPSLPKVNETDRRSIMFPTRGFLSVSGAKRRNNSTRKGEGATLSAWGRWFTFIGHVGPGVGQRTARHRCAERRNPISRRTWQAGRWRGWKEKVPSWRMVRWV